MAIEFRGSGDSEICSIRWGHVHLSEVVSDSDILLGMFDTARHSGHELHSICRAAGERPVADAIDALSREGESMRERLTHDIIG